MKLYFFKLCNNVDIRKASKKKLAYNKACYANFITVIYVTVIDTNPI